MNSALEYVEQARSNRSVPRVHGNGMIQLDIDDNGSRLHFWGHYRIPHQKVATPIHDHVFDFESMVLRGALTNIHYSTTPGCTFTLWDARPRKGQDTELVMSDQRCNLRVERVETIQAGCAYSFEHRRFHETLVVEPTITLMHKFPALGNGDGPWVAIKTGHAPDNEFDRHAFIYDYLWGIIDEMASGY